MTVELAESDLAEITNSGPAKTVYDWMKSRNLFVRALKSEDATFNFEGITETQVGFMITQPCKIPRSIVVVANLEIMPNHVKAMAELVPHERENILWDLKKELIFAPATFFMSPDMNNPKRIQFAKEVSFDELTEGRLLDAMDAVCRSTIWTIWKLIRIFGPVR
ncbi:MAG: DUF2299 family protein [Methanothrix sp.]